MAGLDELTTGQALNEACPSEVRAPRRLPVNRAFLSAETTKGFDTDRTLAPVEIAQDQLYFQVISRAGQTVDSGVIAMAGSHGRE